MKTWTVKIPVSVLHPNLPDFIESFLYGSGCPYFSNWGFIECKSDWVKIRIRSEK